MNGAGLKGSIEALVFDLDDTLYPEMDYVWSGYRAVAARLAGADGAADKIFGMLKATFESGDRSRVFNRVLEQLGRAADGQVVAELVSVYRCHRPVIQLDDGVRELLEGWRDEYRLGLITDGYLPGQRLKVEALGIEDLFDKIIYTEQLGREFWKPSTRAFELMSEALDCAGDSCVYVGDNCGKDFIGPNKLGWQTVRFKRAGGINENVQAVEGGDAGEVIGCLGELVFNGRQEARGKRQK